MGTDLWAAVGRVRPKTNQDVEPRVPGTEFAFFGDRKVGFADFEFYSGRETNLGRNYCVYGWLGDNEFGNNDSLISTLPDIEAKQVATQAFLEWINDEYEKLGDQRLPNDRGNIGDLLGSDIVDDFHFIGDRCYTLHFIKDLVEFDYDQVVVSTERKLIGKTYRELFTQWSNWWFEFLDWAVKKEWEFAIFGFCC